MTPAAIDAQTKLYGVWGDPVGHSLSPAIQNAAFRRAGLNAVYLAFAVPASDLAKAVSGARVLKFSGFNLTVPHKETVLPLLDDVDSLAVQIGAVNTVVRRNDGSLAGYNTDAVGFCEPLKAKTGVQLVGARAVLLGAGGATRAVAFQLAAEGVKSLTIFNRTLSKAQALADNIGKFFPNVEIGADRLVEPIRHPALAAADLVVHCTTRGLNDAPLNLDWAQLPQNAIVTDLVYGRTNTGFLQAASARGHVVHDGLWMLLGQAAEAFRLWTGAAFDLDQAKAELTASWTKNA